MSDTFKPGDIVIIRSAGPGMTVRREIERVGGEKFVECYWFDGHIKTETFPSAIMKKWEWPKKDQV